MKYLYLLLAALLSLSCRQEGKTVVVAGDSWGFFLCLNGSLDRALKKALVSDATANVNCALTTRIGMRAEDWLASKFHQSTLKTLNNPGVRVLYLSLGGNDFLNHWKNTLTPEEQQEAFAKTHKIIADIVAVYRAARPDIKILLSGYDFPRFVPDHPIQAYREAYEDMGRPTAAQINRAILDFSQHTSELADQKDIFYIQHYGLMHYYMGNREAHLEPGTSLPPEQISPPENTSLSGGNPEVLNDSSAMLRVANLVDAFHLSSFGFDMLAEHSVNRYLREWLRP